MALWSFLESCRWNLKPRSDGLMSIAWCPWSLLVSYGLDQSICMLRRSSMIRWAHAYCYKSLLVCARLLLLSPLVCPGLSCWQLHILDPSNWNLNACCDGQLRIRWAHAYCQISSPLFLHRILQPEQWPLKKADNALQQCSNVAMWLTSVSTTLSLYLQWTPPSCPDSLTEVKGQKYGRKQKTLSIILYS